MRKRKEAAVNESNKGVFMCTYFSSIQMNSVNRKNENIVELYENISQIMNKTLKTPGVFQ